MFRIQSHRIISISCFWALALINLPILAQHHQDDRERGRKDRQGPDSNVSDFRLVSSLLRFSSKVVKDAPFSATVETEFVQTLGDGTRISRKSSGTIARDREGRTRREQTVEGIGPLSASESGIKPRKMVFIHDPVQELEYVINLNEKTVEKKTFHHLPPPPKPELPRTAYAKIEPLGKQIIEGLEAEGTRSVIFIPTGQIGNDRALEIVAEQWYAPALQEIILSKHRDPRMGENVYRLVKINRAEPAASQFQPPADFKSSGPPFDKERRRGRKPDDFDEEKQNYKRDIFEKREDGF